MESKSITACICAFSRAYHSEHNEVKIFDDMIARSILSDEEYETISDNMANGIMYFNPGFAGSKSEALRWIVDNQLSQTPLARAAFAEKSLKEAVIQGTEQYLICGAGYDTFAYRQPDWGKNLKIFEIDQPASADDKKKRLERSGITPSDNVYYVKANFTDKNWVNELLCCNAFDQDKVSFCSILGLIYYLTKEDLEQYISIMSTILSVKSRLVFDYPNESYFEMQKKHSSLAEATNEAMQACYSIGEMKELLEKYHFQIVEHLNSEEMTIQYFSEYNMANSAHPMKAQKNVNYCLCEKI